MWNKTCKSCGYNFMTYDYREEQCSVCNGSLCSGSIITAGNTAGLLNNSNVITTSGSIPILSSEEYDELCELNEQQELAGKNNMRVAFMKLPAHLRQSIIDEVYMYDFHSDILSQECKPITERHNELMHRYNGGSAERDYANPCKYPIIKNFFTLEELENMHAEACVESLIK